MCGLCLELGITCIAKACTRYFTLLMVCVPVFVQKAQQMVMGVRLNIFESFFVSSKVLADISVTPLRNMGVRMLRKQKIFRLERIIWNNNNKEVRLTCQFSSEGNYLTKAIISNVAHWKSCPKYFVL